MKVIKIDEMTDKNITFLCNKVGCTKQNFVKIVMEYLTNKQLGDIWNRKIHNMAEVRNYEGKFDKMDSKNYGSDSVGNDKPEYTSYGDIICKECGMGSDECDCVEEIDWDDEDDEDDLPEDN